jgi:hypothetical protein
MLHTFPFLIPNLGIALKLAYAVVVCELIAIAFIRYRFMGGKLANTIVQVVSAAVSYSQLASGSAGSVQAELFGAPAATTKSWPAGASQQA